MPNTHFKSIFSLLQSLAGKIQQKQNPLGWWAPVHRYSQDCHWYPLVKPEHTRHSLNGTTAGAMPHPVINVLCNSIVLGYILHSTGKGSRSFYLFLLTFRKVPWTLPWTTMRKYKMNDMWSPILMSRCVAPRMEDGKRKCLVCSWWLAGNVMHMFSQMKQNSTRPWAFLPPPHPCLI